MTHHENSHGHTEMPPLGEDPNDDFSLIIDTEDLKTESGLVIGKKITKKRRANPTKPGRTLGVEYDARVPIGEGFKDLNYIYTMRFTRQPGEESDPAGKHYHHEKNEFFSSSIGRFLIVLEDRSTLEQVRLELHDNTEDDHGNELQTGVFVPVEVAHAVKPLDIGRSALLVLADHPNGHGDEIAYPEMKV